MGGLIEKVLTDGDLEYHYRVKLPKRETKTQIVEYLNNDEKQSLENGEKIDVTVMDNNENVQRTMKLSYYRGSYYLSGGWGIVVRSRNLVAGDILQIQSHIHSGALNMWTIKS